MHRELSQDAVKKCGRSFFPEWFRATALHTFGGGQADMTLPYQCDWSSDLIGRDRCVERHGLEIRFAGWAAGYIQRQLIQIDRSRGN